jgi:hypothetical protein
MDRGKAVATDHARDELIEQRELLQQLTRAGLELVERFGWTRERVECALDYELRELLADSADDDKEFRNWYAQWRKENPS